MLNITDRQRRLISLIRQMKDSREALDMPPTMTNQYDAIMLQARQQLPRDLERNLTKILGL